MTFNDLVKRLVAVGEKQDIGNQEVEMMVKDFDGNRLTIKSIDSIKIITPENEPTHVKIEMSA